MADLDQLPISLLEILEKSSGFDGAMLTTYNAYLPFVEEVVLRRLHGAGCNYAVVLMDGRELGEELSVSTHRPRLAGKRYGLLPVACGGVFHPKLALLIGPKAARILIGSHNLTMSGVLHNREITNQIEVDGPKDREGAAALLEILSFCKAWSAGLPDALQEALEPIDAFCRSYRGPVPEDPDLKIVGARPDGPNLWRRVRPLLPDSVKRVAFLGPFYDEGLAFVRQAMADLSPERVVVGIDPATAMFPGDLHQLPRDLRVVDMHDWDPGHKGRGYLHGKAILVEAKSARFLITGSANPTAAAWLKPPNTRNAEIVAIRRLPLRGGNELGLDGLWDAPTVASSALSKLRVLSESPQRLASTGIPLVGIRSGATFRVDAEFAEVQLVTVWDSDHGTLPSQWTKVGSNLIVDVGDDIDSASVFDVVADGKSRLGLIHHSALLRQEAAPSSQRRVREAMGGLNSGDPTQLEKFLRLVEKVVFESPSVEIALGYKAIPKPVVGAPAQSESTAGIVKTIASRKEAERHRLSSGDIGLLIDYLMRKLWRGMEHEQATGTRSEIELMNSDDEEVAPQEFGDREIAQAWYKKSRTLLRRLENRILKANDAAQIVMETTAILGVLEALRRVEEQDRWKSLRLEFLDRDRMEHFAMAVVPRLLQPGTGLLDVAREEVGVPFAEEQLLIEWVAWMAWLTGLGPTDAWELPDSNAWLGKDGAMPGAIADRMARACLVGARLPLVNSQRVLELLDATPFAGADSRSWLRTLERLGEVYSNPASAARLVRSPALGDLVMTDHGVGPLVVHRVRGDKADLVDFSRVEGRVTFRREHLRVIDAGLEQIRRAVG